MDIPIKILAELICSECGNYLSRGPVYQLSDGNAVCGLCYENDEKATRNVMYESAAKLLKFPCKYQSLGCIETVPYSETNEDLPHEQGCEYREFACPIAESGDCDWIGTRNELLDHCLDEHSDEVIENSSELAYDLTTSSSKTHLLTAFEHLFLLHTKICLTSGKLFNAVRHIGDPETTNKYGYSLVINREDIYFSKTGKISSPGSLEIEENISLVINITSLLEILEGYGDISFSVTVKKIVEDKFACVKCNEELSAFLYRDEKGWLCENCLPRKRSCENKLCSFRDFDEKCKKHELINCQYCWLCNKKLQEEKGKMVKLNAHYGTSHYDITYSSGATWPISIPYSYQNFCVLSEAGIAICKFYYSKSVMQINIYTPVLTAHLNEYHCLIRLIHTESNIEHIYIPELSYNESFDWNIEINSDDFPDWKRDWANYSRFNVRIDINKIASVSFLYKNLY